MLVGARVQCCLATTNREQARAFFEGVLGLAVRSEDDFAIVFDMGNAVLRVTTVKSFIPQPFSVLGWTVPDVAATVRDLTARGVTFERYPGMGQDDLGIWTPPGGGAVAWFKDPDGNLLGVSAEH